MKKKWEIALNIALVVLALALAALLFTQGNTLLGAGAAVLALLNAAALLLRLRDR